MKKSKNEVEKLKLDILDAAELIFLKKNYSEVNVREITEQLGITRTPISMISLPVWIILLSTLFSMQ